MPGASQMLDVLDAHRSQSWSTQDDLHLVLNHIALPEGDPTRRVVSGRSRSEGEKRMRQLLRALRTLPVDVASLVTAAHRDELPGLTATLARVRSSEGRRSIAAEGAGTNTKGDGASDEKSFTFHSRRFYGNWDFEVGNYGNYGKCKLRTVITCKSVVENSQLLDSCRHGS